MSRLFLSCLLVLTLTACSEPGSSGIFDGLRGANNDAPLAAKRTGGGGGNFGAPVRGFVRLAQGGDAAAAGRPGGANGPGIFTMNYENTPLQEVVRTVMEEGLGANYLIDERVTGTVTIRTNQPLTQSQILPVLDEILRLNNAAIVDRAGVLNVVPRAQAGLPPPQMTSGAATSRGLTLRVTPLSNVSVDQTRDVLAAFSPVTGSITFEPGRNLVFSVGTRAEQDALAEVIAVIDQPSLSNQSIALRPLRNSDPMEVAGELEAIFGSAHQFIPVERLQAVLILSRSGPTVQDAVEIIASLDQASGKGPRLHVFRVENRRASEIGPILADLVGAGFSGGAQTTALAPSEEQVVETTAAAVEAPAQAIGGGDLTLNANGVGRLTIDNGSNAILAIANADGARLISRTLARLDSQTLQVQLNATLAEVRLNEELEYGIRFFFQDGNFSGSFSDAASGATGSVFPGFNAVFETQNVRATLSALDQVTDVKLVSSPTLMVRDSQPARLQIGDQVPVTTRSSTSVTDPDAPIVTETEFRDTGIILSILPRVNANGVVTLDIRQEVSEVQDTTASGNPTFSQRVVESSVIVDSGDTIAIAGLIRDSAGRGSLGLPGLRSIPILGSRSSSRDRTELVVLITPTVVRDQRGSRAATAEIRGKLKTIFGN